VLGLWLGREREREREREKERERERKREVRCNKKRSVEKNFYISSLPKFSSEK
jgi:hypothetical protein